MGCCRLGLAVAVTLCLFIALKPEPARAASVAAFAVTRAGGASASGAVQESPRLSVHFRRWGSSYCLPRNYWWFYRPYTTAQEGFARCMPYFHYLEQPYDRRGAKPDRLIK
jgi:hypothetical protein